MVWMFFHLFKSFVSQDSVLVLLYFDVVHKLFIHILTFVVGIINGSFLPLFLLNGCVLYFTITVVRP